MQEQSVIFQATLPSKPHIADPIRWAALAERYLMPVLYEMEVSLLAIVSAQKGCG